MAILIIVLLIFLAIVGLGVFFGAPFVPTRKIWIRDALLLAEISQSDVVVDLGSGDGAVLREALKSGAKKVIGYEINPILVFISRLKLRKFNKISRKISAPKGNTSSPKSDQKIPASDKFLSRKFEIKLANFFRETLPPDTTVIYLFQIQSIANKIPAWLRVQRKNLRAKKIKVITFGFELPGETIVRENHGMILYEF